MIVNITTRASKAEWSKDLDVGMAHIGSYRMNHLQHDLMKALNDLVDLVNQYHGASAFRQDKPQCPEEYLLGIKVSHLEAGFPFWAYVGLRVDDNHALIGVLYFTERATTNEFPLEKNVQWKTEEFHEKPEDLSAILVTWIKNYMIQYLSFQVVGRDVIYAVLEE